MSGQQITSRAKDPRTSRSITMSQTAWDFIDELAREEVNKPSRILERLVRDAKRTQKKDARRSE